MFHLHRSRRLLILTLTFGVVVPLSGQTMSIRLGTVAPRSSPWVEELQRMGQAWSDATSKRVRFVPYADLASEGSVLARMGTSGLDAAALSVAGLAEIDDAFNVLGIPFFFESDAELIHVLERLTPVLSARIEAKRHHLVLWGHGGWVQIFSKREIRTLGDLQGSKLFTSEGNPRMVQWYTANGFHAVPLAAGEIPKQLKLPTGAIDATPAVPPLALVTQLYKDAPYMLDIRVAPLVAAVVMTDAAWNRLTPEDRSRMLPIAKDTERRLFAQAAGLDARHIKEMQANGLKVAALSQSAGDEFRGAAARLVTTQRGSMVPADIYDLAVRERDAARKTKATK